MMAKEFRKLYVPQEETLSRVQDSIKVCFDSFINDPLLNKLSFTESISASGTTINHTLGRVPNGWLIYDSDANAVIWRVSWTTTTIKLQASAPVNIKFYLF